MNRVQSRRLNRRHNKAVHRSRGRTLFQFESQTSRPGDLGRYVALSTSFVMQNIENSNQLKSVRAKEHAVVFLYVDWSMPARVSATNAKQMIDRWNRDRPNQVATLSMIDISEQSGEIWDATDNWLTSQDLPNRSGLLSAGAGSILWIQSGRVVQYVLNAGAETVDDLLDRMYESLDSHGAPNAT